MKQKFIVWVKRFISLEAASLCPNVTVLSETEKLVSAQYKAVAW